MTTEHSFFYDIDKAQQERWAKAKLFSSPRLPSGKKFYFLDMFPYPSGQGLHVGHPEGYIASDILTRQRRMSGCSVLHPMGWDAFGLPAENYAIETGIHPEITTTKNISNFRNQIKAVGISYDWDREINTTDPEYYKWTQWIFLQLFKRGLAYEGTIPINWCPSCKTGLANEEVFNGKCERCGAEIEHKNMRQWMLRITKYADKLLSGLDKLDWPESTLAMQRNWIGRSEGAEIIFGLENGKKLTVFTTRPDTIFGATYMVIAPEHPIAKELCVGDNKQAAFDYIAAAGKKTEFERSDAEREKTGVFTGSYAINPATGKKIPVWIADYVLAGYGTGAIMAVPAHDDRDYAFAKKFDLPIIEVVRPEDDKTGEELFTGAGVAVNSGALDGLKTAEAKKKIIEILGSATAKATVNYRLRDWVFSRQRYWGEPIPVVHCETCGIQPVPESELPLRLPKMDKFAPSGTGESPLANVPEWINTTCPKCGRPAKRETNTMPQWAGSCWYYLRYIDPKNPKAFCDKELEKAWMPVDCYVGGSEHAVLHLLYARFWHKVLFDLGLVSTEEPFQKLRHQGMILSFSYRDPRGVYHPYNDIDFSQAQPRLAATGEPLTSMVEKMSKSKKNVVNPDEIIREYGADVFRLYEMFMGPFDASKPWDMKSIEGVSRFLKRVWFWIEGLAAKPEGLAGAQDKKLEVLRNKTIEKVTADIDAMHFNTAISSLMIYFNELQPRESVQRVQAETLLKLLHPFAPHATDALWEKIGGKGFLLQAQWPVADKAFLQDDEIEIGVQINGKMRARITIAAGLDNAAVEKTVLANEAVKKHLEGKQVKKVIVIPKKLVSIVVAG